ncbi:hypothetical protein [Bowmanella sp. JS7-9]|uniref:Uncharacterized protein n=1 Tax=Pseudobowmanella zhangzhouensis TaxID=1537679 RepID=A0ABW1XMI7_9ALTE|nr:hypothetical protein [Bowmanella sp. JS7-9]
MVLDIKNVRHKNARLLLAEKCDGVYKNFAATIDRSLSQTSAFLKEDAKVGIGSALARNIERGFNLPERWLDKPQASSKAVSGGGIEDYLKSVHEALAEQNVTFMVKKFSALSKYTAQFMNAKSLVSFSIDSTLKQALSNFYLMAEGKQEAKIITCFLDGTISSGTVDAIVADNFDALFRNSRKVKPKDFWYMTENDQRQMVLVALSDEFKTDYLATRPQSVTLSYLKGKPVMCMNDKQYKVANDVVVESAI